MKGEKNQKCLFVLMTRRGLRGTLSMLDTKTCYYKILQKFEVSNQIFDYFFCRKFSNEERLSLIEDFWVLTMMFLKKDILVRTFQMMWIY